MSSVVPQLDGRFAMSTTGRARAPGASFGGTTGTNAGFSLGGPSQPSPSSRSRAPPAPFETNPAATSAAVQGPATSPLQRRHSLTERLREAAALAQLSSATLRERFLPPSESVAAGDTCISRRELRDICEIDLGVPLSNEDEAHVVAEFGDRRGLVDARRLLESCGLWNRTPSEGRNHLRREEAEFEQGGGLQLPERDVGVSLGGYQGATREEEDSTRSPPWRDELDERAGVRRLHEPNAYRDDDDGLDHDYARNARDSGAIPLPRDFERPDLDRVLSDWPEGESSKAPPQAPPQMDDDLRVVEAMRASEAAASGDGGGVGNGESARLDLERHVMDLERENEALRRAVRAEADMAGAATDEADRQPLTLDVGDTSQRGGSDFLATDRTSTAPSPPAAADSARVTEAPPVEGRAAAPDAPEAPHAPAGGVNTLDHRLLFTSSRGVWSADDVMFGRGNSVPEGAVPRAFPPSPTDDFDGGVVAAHEHKLAWEVSWVVVLTRPLTGSARPLCLRLFVIVRRKGAGPDHLIEGRKLAVPLELRPRDNDCDRLRRVGRPRSTRCGLG